MEEKQENPRQQLQKAYLQIIIIETTIIKRNNSKLFKQYEQKFGGTLCDRLRM